MKSCDKRNARLIAEGEGWKVPEDPDEAEYRHLVWATNDWLATGPWRNLPWWRQETIMSVAQRTARAIIDQYRRENPLPPSQG